MTGVKMLAFVGFVLMAAGLINGYQANHEMESKMKQLVANIQPILPKESDNGALLLERVTYDHKGLTMFGRLLIDDGGISPHRLQSELRAAGRLPLCDHPGIVALMDMGAELRMELSTRDNRKLLNLKVDRKQCAAA